MPDPTLRSDNPSFDEVIEALQEKEITIIFSSGSSGRFSFIPRDKTTSNRGIYSLVQAHNMIPLPNLSNLKLFPLASNLGSTNWALMRGLGVVYELLSSILHQHQVQPEDAGTKRNDVKITTDMVRSSMTKSGGMIEKVKAKVLLTALKRQQNKKLNDFIRFLEECDGEGKDTIIMETPFTIDNIMSRIEEGEKKFNLGNSTLITIGGWKLQEDRRTPEKEFRERVQRVIGIPDEACRDVYGMAECRMLLPPCEGHYKHIPHSILYPMVLNEDLEPLGYGEHGRYAFLDPLSNSFPGFIATGDRVKILESCPACNRPGPVIEHDVSRVKGVEDRGCGLIMKRLLAEALAKAGKGE